MARDERVKRRNRNTDRARPGLTLPAARSGGRSHEIFGRSRYRGIVHVDLQIDLSAGRTDRNRLDRNGMVAAIEPPQDGHQLRLWLNCDHARPEPPKRADAIAYVRAEVED